VLNKQTQKVLFIDTAIKIKKNKVRWKRTFFTLFFHSTNYISYLKMNSFVPGKIKETRNYKN